MNRLQANWVEPSHSQVSKLLSRPSAVSYKYVRDTIRDSKRELGHMSNSSGGVMV